MDIIIGKPVDLRLLEHSRKKKFSGKTGEIRASLLGYRSSRKTAVVLNKGFRDRRANRVFRDPERSRVITLLIEDGDVIPQDIETGNYVITLKFSRE